MPALSAAEAQLAEDGLGRLGDWRDRADERDLRPAEPPSAGGEGHANALRRILHGHARAGVTDPQPRLPAAIVHVGRNPPAGQRITQRDQVLPG